MGDDCTATFISFTVQRSLICVNITTVYTQANQQTNQTGGTDDDTIQDITIRFPVQVGAN